jgi:hypothetical protein
LASRGFIAIGARIFQIEYHSVGTVAEYLADFIGMIAWHEQKATPAFGTVSTEVILLLGRDKDYLL